jgi:hypothetical protein
MGQALQLGRGAFAHGTVARQNQWVFGGDHQVDGLGNGLVVGGGAIEVAIISTF